MSSKSKLMIEAVVNGESPSTLLEADDYDWVRIRTSSIPHALGSVGLKPSQVKVKHAVGEFSMLGIPSSMSQKYLPYLKNWSS